jgi:hypothetical protein
MEYLTRKERAEQSRRVFSNASFKEEEHPRAEDGKFGPGGGGGEKKERKPGKAKTKGVSPKEHERLKGLADMYGRYSKSDNPNQDKNFQALVGRPDISDQQISDLYQIYRKARK